MLQQKVGAYLSPKNQYMGCGLKSSIFPFKLCNMFFLWSLYSWLLKIRPDDKYEIFSHWDEGWEFQHLVNICWIIYPTIHDMSYMVTWSCPWRSVSFNSWNKAHQHHQENLDIRNQNNKSDMSATTASRYGYSNTYVLNRIWPTLLQRMLCTGNSIK